MRAIQGHQKLEGKPDWRWTGRRVENGQSGVMTNERFDIGMDPRNKDAQRQMWDHLWYERFEIPHTIPAEAVRCGPSRSGGAEDLQGVLGCLALYGEHDSLRVVRSRRLLSRSSAAAGRARLRFGESVPAPCPGDIVWDPYLEEVTIAYGRYAFVNF